ncbi:MAG: hypothetical protein ACFE0J_20770 [Elainellaceae cyanobacterium]
MDSSNYTKNPFNHSTSVDSHPSPCDCLVSRDFEHELEKLALFIAQTWRDDHLDAQAASKTDFDTCVSYVTAEMAKAGTVVGGPVGLAILTGGGSAAGCVACRRILSQNSY